MPAQPLPDEVWQANEQALSSSEPMNGAMQKEAVTISVPSISQQTDVRVAEETGALVVLNPTGGGGQALLSYYTSDGALRWQHTISPAMVEMSGGAIFWIEVSDDGKRVVVYASEYEGTSIVAIYDEEGRSLAEYAPFTFLAPSGNYFYGRDSFYAGSGRFVFYDADFNRIDVGLAEAFDIDLEKYEYGTEYRVLEGDILIARVTELEKPEFIPPSQWERNERGRRIPPDPDVGPGKYIRSRLYVYNLKTRRTIANIDLKIENPPDPRTGADMYSISLTDGSVDLEGRTLVSSAGVFGGSSELFEIDLETRVVKTLPLGSHAYLALSKDGSNLLVGNNSKDGRRITIRDLQSDRVLYRVTDERIKTITSFTLKSNQAQFLLRETPKIPPQLVTYAGDTHTGQIFGWFNQQLTQGFVPTRLPDGSSTGLQKVKFEKQ